MFLFFRDDPVKWARSGLSPPFLLRPAPLAAPRDHIEPNSQSPHSKSTRPLLCADRHINTMLPLSAASVRSGVRISHKPTQMRVLSEAVKKGSSIYPTCGLFFFQGREQCCSLWCGFISLQAAAENGCCLVMAAA